MVALSGSHEVVTPDLKTDWIASPAACRKPLACRTAGLLGAASGGRPPRSLRPAPRATRRQRTTRRPRMPAAMARSARAIAAGPPQLVASLATAPPPVASGLHWITLAAASSLLYVLDLDAHAVNRVRTYRATIPRVVLDSLMNASSRLRSGALELRRLSPAARPVKRARAKVTTAMTCLSVTAARHQCATASRCRLTRAARGPRRLARP
jgi:hypothetical protein